MFLQLKNKLFPNLMAYIIIRFDVVHFDRNAVGLPSNLTSTIRKKGESDYLEKYSTSHRTFPDTFQVNGWGGFFFKKKFSF